jgi:ArsR family transcriptional regulator
MLVDIDGSRCIDGCQYAGATMTESAESAVLDVSGCCASLGSEPLAEEPAGTLAEAFKALGDPVRLRLLSLLMTADDARMCACDLVDPVGKSQPTVSHHLKVLKEAGLVRATRQGSNVWYAVVPAQLEALRGVLTPPKGALPAA